MRRKAWHVFAEGLVRPYPWRRSATVMFGSAFACLLLIFGVVHACRDSEVIRRQAAALSIEEIHADNHIWSEAPGTVTRVRDYRDAYDLDTSDEIAHFFLEPTEAQALAAALTPPSEEFLRNYRCGYFLAKSWAPREICDGQAMERTGYVARYRRYSRCSAGCWNHQLLWMRLATGESYLIGAAAH